MPSIDAPSKLTWLDRLLYLLGGMFVSLILFVFGYSVYYDVVLCEQVASRIAEIKSCDKRAFCDVTLEDGKTLSRRVPKVGDWVYYETCPRDPR